MDIIMKRVFWVRRIHKWLALVAGLQVFVWAVSGLYMTVIDLSIIHGDHLVIPADEAPLSTYQLKPISTKLVSQLGPIKSINLKSYFGSPVYEIKTAKNKLIVVDGVTGDLKAELQEAEVRRIANTIYAGDALITHVEKLARYPGEIGGKKQSVWQVEYDDLLKSTLYFHPVSGRLVSKRTHLWRVFDVFFILHIMDFMGSDGHTGYLFRFFSIASLLLAVFGTWLLVFRLKGGVNSGTAE